MFIFYLILFLFFYFFFLNFIFSTNNFGLDYLVYLLLFLIFFYFLFFLGLYLFVLLFVLFSHVFLSDFLFSDIVSDPLIPEGTPSECISSEGTPSEGKKQSSGLDFNIGFITDVKSCKRGYKSYLFFSSNKLNTYHELNIPLRSKRSIFRKGFYLAFSCFKNKR